MADIPEDFPPNFNYVKVGNHFRANLFSETDITQWINLYSKKSMTNWRFKFNKTNPSRYVCRKIFVCHHSGLKRVDPEQNKRGKSKNTDCKAEIDILVKLTTQNTKKKDKFIKEGMPAIITLEGHHNHSQNTAEALSFLKPSEDIREVFEAYFTDGLTVTEAINLHEAKLEIDFSEAGTDMANASINPKYRTVQHWYDVWLTKNLGPRSGDGMIDKLKEKMSSYVKEGITVEVHKDPFAVLIVTKIMKRAHEMPFSKDIVFVDSTASCDAESHSVTFMLSPCSVGAVPLAVLITKGQSNEDYVAAFSLLKKCIPIAFKGQGHPKLFITDDSAAERSALKIVWPKSDSLLCRFHVCQAVWRWLFEKNHNIEKEHRPILYNCFQAILIAETKDLAEAAFKDAMTNPVSCMYRNFIEYLQEYWERRELWCLAWRDAITHGHQTNNFSEVNVRLFKDIVLLRNKAYNVVSLVNFTCTSLEKYYLRRLRHFVNGRRAAPRLFLKAALVKAAYITKEAIKKVDEKLYSVPKESSEGFYEVDAAVGFCSCSFGRLGRFCKHQAAVFKYCNESLPNAPPVTAESRYEIAKLAFGEKAPPLEFYMPLQVDVKESNSAVDAEPMDVVPHCNQVNITQSNEVCNNTAEEHHDSVSGVIVTNSEDTEKERKDLSEEIINILKFNFSKFQTSSTVLKKFLARASKIKTNTAWESFLSTSGSQLSLRHHARASIRVQPTAISRRRNILKGCKKLPVGRPPLQAKNIKKKRKRNLALNVKLNQANAKSHGSGH